VIRLAHRLSRFVLPACFACVCSLLPASAARGQLITIEPDNYAAGTALTNVSPHVTLMTLDGDDEQVPLFTVTSADGDSATTDLSPTGSRVFAHSNVPFWNDVRKLEADFNGTTSSVSVSFAGGTPFTNEIGRLEVYGPAGNLLDFDVTGPTGYGQFETLSITRPTADIARAVVYTSEGSFGRLDALAFNTPVPEPGALGLLALCGALALRRRGN
jgi:MYXO-CTERM domain-containing protein